MPSLDFAGHLLRARVLRHLSQEQLAIKLGTTRVTVSRWEHRVSRPSPQFWPILADFLKLPMETLFFVLPLSVELVSHSETAAEGQSFEPSKEIAEIKRDPLDDIYRQMEWNKKRVQYVQEQVEIILPLLDPQNDPAIRRKVLEQLLLQLDAPDNDADSPMVVPSFRDVKKVFDSVRSELETQEYKRDLHLDRLESRQVQSLLDNLGDIKRLGESQVAQLVAPLVQGKPTSSITERGTMLRQLLKDALEALSGSGSRNDVDVSWRYYNVLYYCYFSSSHGWGQRNIAHRLGFSERQYYRILNAAKQALWDSLLQVITEKEREGAIRVNFAEANESESEKSA